MASLHQYLLMALDNRTMEAEAMAALRAARRTLEPEEVSTLLEPLKHGKPKGEKLNVTIGSVPLGILTELHNDLYRLAEKNGTESIQVRIQDSATSSQQKSVTMTFYGTQEQRGLILKEVEASFSRYQNKIVEPEMREPVQFVPKAPRSTIFGSRPHGRA